MGRIELIVIVASYSLEPEASKHSVWNLNLREAHKCEIRMLRSFRDSFSEPRYLKDHGTIKVLIALPGPQKHVE